MGMLGKTNTTLSALAVGFLGLTVAFLQNPWGHLPPRPTIPLVDTNVLDTAPVRRSYADLLKAGEDLSDFDCYTCHEKGKPPPIRYDENHRIILPKEHSNIVMQHGSHERNNHCFNCHNELNLERFQTRDGRELPFAQSTELCGSCHGPTYRDWEAGVHGRTSGFWDRTRGPIRREDCVNCHDPHAPEFPGRKPAPGPHPLRPAASHLAHAIEPAHSAP
ncbi:MAG: hypothetical protein N3I86_12985 [Verrucomicrobiae bacterium]|nr:hypothetical protein [Verrucomicrobiae bacterium]MDW8310587.1 cytochrome c3 family protein [Verrucomicrobiales bacterium]